MKTHILFLIVFLGFNVCLLSRVSGADETSMGDIIKKTREMYNSGVDRKTIAEYINKEVDDRIVSTNNGETFNPLNWYSLFKNRKKPDLESGSYNDIANVAWTTRLGNCEENSTIVYYILKKAGVKEHVRIMRTAKHSFTVWGIQPSARTDKPSTWGEDAIVVDPWLGRNISGEEVETNKWFMNNNKDAKLTDFTTYSDEAAESWNSINSKYNREHNIKPDPENRTDENVDCFIATAVYGTPQAPEIQVLRTYRDKVLRTHAPGRLFISLYEKFGPVFAFLIKSNEKEKLWVREKIVEPSVTFAKEELKNQEK
jgi:hypothetical protein